MSESGKSLNWVIAALAIAVAAFGWGFLAGSYAGAHAKPMSEMNEQELKEFSEGGILRTRKENFATFIQIGCEQLPNLPAVIAWHFSNRIWLPILVVLLEVGVFAAGYGMKRVEQQLEQPRHRRR